MPIVFATVTGDAINAYSTAAVGKNETNASYVEHRDCGVQISLRSPFCAG